MALALHRLQQCYVLRFIGRKWWNTYFFPQRLTSNCSVLLEVDTLDGFTTQLMQRKSANWEQMLAERRKLSKQNIQLPKENSCFIQYDIHVEQYNLIELNSALRDAIENCNTLLLNYLINECIVCNKLPSCTILYQVLSVYSAEGDKNTILKIINLCEKLDPHTLEANSGFLHYIAEATWIKGNINEAVRLFETIYRNNNHLRRKIGMMLKCLILNVVPNHSEAALLTVISGMVRIANEFNDFLPLMYVWKICFLSEWYSDQCLAIELLQRHEGLYQVLSMKLTYIVALALKKNQTDIVYRLLEVLLVLKQTSYYAKVLEVLFDYRVHQGDLRSCIEIMQWAVDHDIDLPALQQQKFVDLLLSHKVGLSLRAGTRSKEASDSTTLNYKF